MFHMECFNLIYRLLVLFSITLALIGIWQSWDKVYLFLLLSATCLLLCGRWVRDMYAKFVYGYLWMRGRVVTSFCTLVIEASNYLERKIQKWELSDTMPSLLLLSPKADAEAHKEYIRRLKAAIDNSDVHNIALSGAYGSGKSSILKTFKACFTDYKTVYVSLASFGEKGGNEDKDENRLEYRILQQLFYQVKMSDISESRFGRIERTSLVGKILWTLLLCLMAASYVCLFKAEWLQKMLPKVSSVFKQEYINVISLAVLVLGLAFLVFKLVHFLKRLGLKNLGVNVSSASLEVEDKKNVTAMNRYLDEILYLFQRKKYEVVFFEDLDRFGDIRIFTKLRELNQLLNQSEEINRRVVFVYALCDDVFGCPEDRTKFFDYIIPVIPYVNVSNSGDLFKRSFMELQLPKDSLSTEFLTDISHFVNDTRVLKNIVNEFTLYHQVLDTKLDLQHLLAIILYKNLYPKDFCLLHQGKGMLYDVFASVPLLKKEKRNLIQARMQKINDDVKKINDENLGNVNELNALVVAYFLRQIPGRDKYPKDFNDYDVSVEQLFSDDYVSLILQGKMGYPSFNGRCKPISRDQMMQALGEDFDYEKRKEVIEKRNDGELDRLYNERNRLDNKLTYLENLQLHDLVDNVQGVFAYVEAYQQLDDKRKSEYDILGYLLKEGYIDEDYFYYISIFQEGRMTQQDHDFLMSVKFDKPKGYGYKLTEVETIVTNLKNTDYNKPAIVNFCLLQFLLEKEEAYANQCYMFFATLLQTEGLDAIYDYVRLYGSVSVFVRRLVRFHIGFVDELFADKTHSLQDKLKMMALVFAHAEIDDIRRINEYHPIGKHLNDIDEYWEAFALCDENKALGILDIICLKLKTLKDGNSPLCTRLLEHICESRMFQLNLNNIRFVAEKNGLEVENQDGSVYSCILNGNLQFLKKYVQDDINGFAENVVKDKYENFVSEEEVIGLLKNKRVKYGTKIDLIYHKDFLVKDGKEMDPDLLLFLIDADKIFASLDNVMVCYTSEDNKFLKELVDFMNRHRAEIADDIKSKTEIETGYDILLPAIITEACLDKDFSYAIFDNPFLGEIWKKQVSLLNEEQLFYVLRKKYVSFDYMNSKVANRFLHYYMEDDSEFNYGLFIKSLEDSEDEVLKAMASAKCIAKRMLHFKEIPHCLTAMGDSFEKFKRVGDNVKIPNVDGYKELVDALHSVKYLGKVVPMGKEISVRVLKH